MSAKVVPFADNWAYLKTELGWLERLLLAAVAKQRRDNHEVSKIAQSPADRATSHWWKGIITLNQPAFYDDCRVPPQSSSGKQGYQQLLAARIQASQSEQIPLALPLLCDRFQLTLAEKNLVLLALAPEVNRRYGRLYRYLQADTQKLLGVPTVDLGLRLFCRNDLEWRRLRSRLAEPSSFMHQLLYASEKEPAPLLDRYLQLAPALVNYLIAETPQPAALQTIVDSAGAATSTLSAQRYTTPQWQDVILSPSLRQSLQGLAQQTAVNLRSHTARGQIVLLAGRAGTGKTYAAKAIAQTLQQPLTLIDLAQLTPEASQALLGDNALLAAPLVLVRTAEKWLGRQAAVETALNRWLTQRRQVPSLTLLTTHFIQSIRPHWRYQLDGVFELPLPNAKQRRQLWQQAVQQTGIAADIDWSPIVRLALSGGEIQAIAQTALAYAQAEASPTVQLCHLQQAAMLRGKSFRLQS